MRWMHFKNQLKKRHLRATGPGKALGASKRQTVVTPDRRGVVAVIADAFSGVPETRIVVAPRAKKVAHGNIMAKGRGLSHQMARAVAAEAEVDDTR